MSRMALLGAGALEPWVRNSMALAASLVAFWRLDESSGTRLDSVGTNHLSDNNTVTSAAGNIYSLAAEFVIANSEFLSILDNATLSAGNIDMWGAVWCRPAAVNVSSCIMGKFNASANREWQLAQINSDVLLQVSPDGTAIGNGTITAAGVLAANTWTLIVWYHDSVNNVIGLSINGGAFATAAHSTGIFNSASALTIGRQGGASATHFGGRIQSVALGKNYVPTQADAVFLATAPK